MRKTRRKNKFNPLLLLIMGLMLISIGSIQKIQAISSLSFNGEVQTINVVPLNPPTQIIIPSLSINLPVFQTQIVKSVWEVSDKGISHLSNSSNPDDKGNIILYGHNTIDRLGTLHDIKKDELIHIKNAEGDTYTYAVYSKEIVDPTDMEKLYEFNGETVSIYTCTGFADLKRLLVKARRVTD